jgi:hypothetical protein
VGLTAAITEDEEGDDGEPPRGCYQWVQQWPPLRLNKVSMVGPLGATFDGSGSGDHRG